MSKLTLKNCKIIDFYSIPVEDLEKTEENDMDEMILETVENLRSEYLKMKHIESIRGILGKINQEETENDRGD